MTQLSRERVLTLVLLSCYGAKFGKLPESMVAQVLDTLKGKTFDTVEDFVEACELVAAAWVKTDGAAFNTVSRDSSLN